jgi:hypothetical protein
VPLDIRGHAIEKALMHNFEILLKIAKAAILRIVLAELRVLEVEANFAESLQTVGNLGIAVAPELVAYLAREDKPKPLLLHEDGKLVELLKVIARKVVERKKDVGIDE